MFSPFSKDIPIQIKLSFDQNFDTFFVPPEMARFLIVHSSNEKGAQRPWLW